MHNKDKTIINQGGILLTPSEIKRLSRMEPGETTVIDGMLLTCRRSKPHLTGANCQMCTLHKIGCRGVACMANVPFEDAEGRIVKRNYDICFAAYLGGKTRKRKAHGNTQG